MGLTYDDFTVVNMDDDTKARLGVIKESDIRSLTLNFLIDTGANHVFIPESAQEKLRLTERRTKVVTIAGNKKVLCKIVGPMQLVWHNREVIMEAAIMPGQNKPVMGVLGLEGLALMVDPGTQKLVGQFGPDVMGIMV
jgi:clan AA aspartic protease